MKFCFACTLAIGREVLVVHMAVAVANWLVPVVSCVDVPA